MDAKSIGLHKSQLLTPCLVIDKVKLLHNLEYMQNLATQKGVRLRPHAKTHKCSEIAKLQLQYGACGISVAKVSEAYVMASSGISGLLITSPIVPLNKIEILGAVLKLAPDTMIVMDNLENAKVINDFMNKGKMQVGVLLDIDAGIGRTGANITNAIEVAKELNNFDALIFKGLQCYAGHLQHISDLEERRQKSHEILQKASEIKNKLNLLGLNCEILSGSGTGSFSIDAEISGITEIQPGSYVVMDQEYSNVEYKENKFGVAMTFLTTVISANHTTHVTVDAGTKAMYQVTTKPRVISHPGTLYEWGGFGDEHGKVSVETGYRLPELGEVLELVVAHCDPTINLFDKFYITENDIVVDVWRIDARGCSG